MIVLISNLLYLIKSLQVMEHYDLVITAEYFYTCYLQTCGIPSLHNTKTYTDSLDKLKRLFISPITKKGLVFKHDTKQSIFHAIIKNFTLIRGQGDGTDQSLYSGPTSQSCNVIKISR